jgi:stress response protein YsnF|tara:strand:- start:2901 stop:3140 length:240 start_codon:yes stop_codon:yes gene_type:complete
MFSPLLNTSTLTEDELLEKINNIANKIASARRAYMSGELIQQMEMIYHQLNTEYQERLTIKNTKDESTVVEIGKIEGED